MGSHKRRKLSSKQQKVHYMVLCGNRRAEETANAKALGQQQMCVWNKRKVSVAEASLARGRLSSSVLDTPLCILKITSFLSSPELFKIGGRGARLNYPRLSPRL